MDAIEKRARERGLAPVTRFRLAKHFSFRANRADARALPAWIRAEGFEIVHCHRRQDHWVAGRAARRTDRKIRVVRSLHDGTPLGRGLRDRWLLARTTDALLYASRSALDRDQTRHRWRDGFARVLTPALDLARFDPKALPDLRTALGIPPGTVVIGIAARVQAKRRFDFLLHSFKRASRALPNLRLLIIGRGTRLDAVARRPAQQLGIADRVIFAGYRREDYAAALNAMDLKVFLVPGSDGTCRALREAMALGKPAIVSSRGMLPEIVADGVDGIVVAETGSAFIEALQRLGGDAKLRKRMGEAARAKALGEWSLDLQAERAEAVYRELLTASAATRA